MRSEDFRAGMVTLAREARGLSQTDLAKRIGVRQGTVSKIENGQLAPEDDLILKLAGALSVPQSFFAQEISLRNLPISFFRKYGDAGSYAVKAIRARANIIRSHLRTLFRSTELADPKVTPLDIEDFQGSPDRAARAVRANWRVPPGPIDNITRLLEDNGVVVVRCDFLSKRIDGLSLWELDDAIPPIVFASSAAPTDRYRFTLAHELAHIFLHHHLTIKTDRDIESEANAFASEFLLPSSEIRGQLSGLTLKRLAELKMHWKVSMQAVLMKAKALGRISQYQGRRLWMQLSALGYRTEEPVPLPPEEPTLVRELIDIHRRDLGYNDDEIASSLHVTLDEMRELYTPAGRGGLRVVK
jgi:Zn-dependent peptidase ImmA (M78 family)/transcriptional regulator with XRE-family HTH domain